MPTKANTKLFIYTSIANALDLATSIPVFLNGGTELNEWMRITNDPYISASLGVLFAELIIVVAYLLTMTKYKPLVAMGFTLLILMLALKVLACINNISLVYNLPIYYPIHDFLLKLMNYNLYNMLFSIIHN
jgi:hypothetical protein